MARAEGIDGDMRKEWCAYLDTMPFAPVNGRKKPIMVIGRAQMLLCVLYVMRRHTTQEFFIARAGLHNVPKRCSYESPIGRITRYGAVLRVVWYLRLSNEVLIRRRS
ncbi:hypothetical protein NL30_36945 [Burkholderia contaminans]|nr:hypothetical protein NL30_36945 [Burkholderia contaminans]